jgi:hypothetical protein
LRSLEATAVAVMDSANLAGEAGRSVAAEELDRLGQFRGRVYRCLGRRRDELFELTDALLCVEGPVQSLAGLCLTPEHRRGHGALYDALNWRTVDVDRLRAELTDLPLPRMFGGRIVLAVDGSGWLRRRPRRSHQGAWSSGGLRRSRPS